LERGMVAASEENYSKSKAPMCPPGECTVDMNLKIRIYIWVTFVLGMNSCMS
jgi:hypothetical protein